MAEKLLATIACLLALTQVNSVELNGEGKIKISAYTTAGCGDTVRFVRDQLAETYRLYGQFLDIEFIPYGKSRWGLVGEEYYENLTCQFGVNDCWANHYQRCALSLLKGNQTAQVHFMTCDFNAPRPSFTLGSYQCAQAIGLNLIELDFCVSNNHNALAREAQIASVEPILAFDYVPTIVLNDVIAETRAEHNQIESRLASVICFILASHPETGITSCHI